MVARNRLNIPNHRLSSVRVAKGELIGWLLVWFPNVRKGGLMLDNALTQMRSKNLDEGKYADGQGLWLIKRNKIAGKWQLPVVVRGKRREKGLGRWPDVAIAEARGRAAQARMLIRDGLDPIEEHKKSVKDYLPLRSLRQRKDALRRGGPA